MIDYKTLMEAPVSFWALTVSDLLNTTNGCGPQSWRYNFVPDSFVGLSMDVPCRIHDHEYGIGTTKQDKQNADRRLRRNLIALIRHETTGPVLLGVRLAEAEGFYIVVAFRGDAAFWAGKNSREEY